MKKSRNYLEAVKNKEYDFAGWATRHDVKCDDGVIIRHGAFENDHGKICALVMQHQRNDEDMYLGEALLEHRKEGVWAYAFLGDGQMADHARIMVQHGDIDSFSIYAHAKREGTSVVSGEIGEVSLVAAGKNPGALIDYTTVQHGDGDEDFEAIMQFGHTFEHGNGDGSNDGFIEKHIAFVDMETGYLEGEEDEDEDDEDENQNDVQHGKDRTVGDVLKTFNDEQLLAMASIVEDIIEGKSNIKLEQGDSNMKENAFNANKQQNGVKKEIADIMIQHGEGIDIIKAAQTSTNGSIAEATRQAIERKIVAKGYTKGLDTYMVEHGITNIGLLFPDYHQVDSQILTIKDMHTEAALIMNSAKKYPWAMLKSTMANIPASELIANGYITGDEKLNHELEVLQRTIHPATVYAKQEIDRDVVLDVTDYNIIVFFQNEMREALINTIVKAMLVGDGKLATDRTKIPTTKIIPIIGDDPLFAMPYTTENALTLVDEWLVDSSDLMSKHGEPSLIMHKKAFAALLRQKDGFQHYMWSDIEAIKNKLGVSSIILTSLMPVDKAIFVNMADYGLGSDKGGEISWFDDFKIDFNTYQYLIETRVSGGLMYPKSAAVYTFTNPLPVKDNMALKAPITKFTNGVTDGTTGVFPAAVPVSGKYGLNGAMTVAEDAGTPAAPISNTPVTPTTNEKSK